MGIQHWRSLDAEDGDFYLNINIKTGEKKKKRGVGLGPVAFRGKPQKLFFLPS